MLKLKSLLFFLSICVICGGAKLYKETVRGMVVDENLKPVAGAQVVLKYGKQITVPLPIKDISGKTAGPTAIALNEPNYTEVKAETDAAGIFTIVSECGLEIEGVYKDGYAWDRSFKNDYVNNYLTRGNRDPEGYPRKLFMLYDVKGYDKNNLKQIAFKDVELWAEKTHFYVDLIKGVCHTNPPEVYDIEIYYEMIPWPNQINSWKFSTFKIIVKEGGVIHLSNDFPLAPKEGYVASATYKERGGGLLQPENDFTLTPEQKYSVLSTFEYAGSFYVKSRKGNCYSKVAIIFDMNPWRHKAYSIENIEKRIEVIKQAPKAVMSCSGYYNTKSRYLYSEEEWPPENTPINVIDYGFKKYPMLSE